MKDIFETLILDFHKKLREDALPKPVKRDIHIPLLQSKADAIIGVRRSGKTWLLFQKIKELLKSGVSLHSILYMNFEDERILPLSSKELDTLLKTYYYLYPDITNKKKYFFLDEIQNIYNWEKFVRRLMEEENGNVVLTGSSAKLLSKEIATTLRGRSLTTEIYPLSFREFLRFKNIDLSFPLKFDTSLKAILMKYFKEYMLIGGFPEVQNYSDFIRIKTLQEYTSSIVLRDVAERWGLKNLSVLRIIVKNLINNPATLFSINKLFNHIKSLGIKTDKNFVYEAVERLEDAFFLFLVKKHSQSEKAKQVNPSKIYLIDQGLVVANLKKPKPDFGRLLENIVFLHLKRSNLEIEYYRSKKSEVDFIVYDPITKANSIIQVSLSIENKKTLERELTGLKEAMEKSANLCSYLLVNEDREDEIQCGNKKIKIIPVWKFLLYPKDYFLKGF